MANQRSARVLENLRVRNLWQVAIVVPTLWLGVSAFGQQDIGTAFTYQGTLENGSGPVTDTCDFRFGLWNDAAAGAQVGGSPVTVAAVDVVAGSFSAAIDFGAGAINGDARWLEIEVQCPGDAGFTLLSPRVELTPAPHATRAVSGVGPPNAIEIDSANSRVGIGTAAPTQPLHVVGTILSENPGTSPAGSTVRFGGPSSDPGVVIQRGDGVGGVARQWDIVVEHTNDLEIRDNTAGGLERMVIDTTGRVGIGTITPGEQLTVAGTVHSTTGGFKFPDGTTQTTAASGGGTGSTLDGAYDQGGPGAGRIITADAGAVEIQGSGGLAVSGAIQSGNSIVIDGNAYTVTSDDDLEMHVASGRALRMETNFSSPNLIGGYSGNAVTLGVSGGTISGGGSNTNLNLVTDIYGTVGGGRDNQAGDGTGSVADRGYATVGGGSGNLASGQLSTVGGGTLNNAIGSHSTIGGGANSTASGTYSSVGGGNTNLASGSRATVPGGSSNTAGGDNSLAAGNRAKVRSAAQVGGGDTDGDQGTFVWGDSTAADFTSTGPDQFLIRASGGVGIGTASPSATLDVAGSLEVDGSTLNVDSDNNRVGVRTSFPDVSLQIAGGTELTLADDTGWFMIGDQESVNLAFDTNEIQSRINGLPTTLEINGQGGNVYMIGTGPGNVGIGTTSPSARLHVVGSIRATGSLIVEGSITGDIHVSQITGLIGTGYTLQFPDVMDNTAKLEVQGFGGPGDVVVITGPGYDIERVPGFNGQGDPNDTPGLSMEHPFIFEAAGPLRDEFVLYFDDYLADPGNGSPLTMSLIIERLNGTEALRWNFFEYAPVSYEPGTDGRTRFELVHVFPPNNQDHVQMEGNFGNAESNNPATDERVEIAGITAPFYPQLVEDETERTLTLTYDFVEGNGIFEWVLDTIEGTATRRAVTWTLDVGQRNYFDCFPIRYEQFTGFGLDTKVKARVVLSYDVVQQK